MKKIIVLILALALTLSLAACSIGGSTGTGSNSAGGNTPAASSNAGGGDGGQNNSTPAATNSGGDNGSNKAPDGVTYVEPDAYAIDWPTSGLATKIPKFVGVTIDDPYSVEDYAKISPVNIPRTQYDSYVGALKSAGFSLTGSTDDEGYAGNGVTLLAKDNINVRVDYDNQYNSMIITVSLLNS